MYLDQILRQLDKGIEVHSQHPPQLDRMDVVDIENDSRLVQPGSLFVALEGSQEDGKKYIKDAIQKGAIGIFASKEACLELYSHYPTLVFLSHPHVKEIYYKLIFLFYPKKPGFLAAVTGTSGKTSVVDFTRQIWKALGYASASIGTLGVITGDTEEYHSLTTLGPLALARTLQKLEVQGISHVALEASSHGLHQGRLKNLKFQVVGFTNFSQDHLDYHTTMSDYLEAKLLLFKEYMMPQTTAVINADLPIFNAIKNAVGLCSLITYGKVSQDITLNYIQPLAVGQRISITVFGKRSRLDFPLIGRFQVINALCALGIVLAENPERTEEAIKALEHLEGVPGRLEFVGHTSQGAVVYTDYAHKPEALKFALEALRPHTKNHLHVIFGCGGNRDKLKRPIMGKIAAECADHITVTDDNPRHENSAEIRKEVMVGCPHAKNIGDRKEAIKEALATAKSGDVILIAGKGHETEQIIGNEAIPFKDSEVVLELLRG